MGPMRKEGRADSRSSCSSCRNTPSQESITKPPLAVEGCDKHARYQEAAIPFGLLPRHLPKRLPVAAAATSNIKPLPPPQ